MVRYLTDMVDITANKIFNAEKQFNAISGLQIQFY